MTAIIISTTVCNIISPPYAIYKTISAHHKYIHTYTLVPHSNPIVAESL